MIRKVQERKESERLAANVSGEREAGVQERGVSDAVDEKQMQGREPKEMQRNKDVEVLTKSVRSMSL